MTPISFLTMSGRALREEMTAPPIRTMNVLCENCSFCGILPTSLCSPLFHDMIFGCY